MMEGSIMFFRAAYVAGAIRCWVEHPRWTASIAQISDQFRLARKFLGKHKQLKWSNMTL
jgi:hypothetical protein